jgi:hypothetical protein
MECGGKVKRRHRFLHDYANSESGVALRFPPHSKVTARAGFHY